MEELEDSLPNGFHDSLIQRITRDLIAGELVMDLEILVGLPREPRVDRDRYQAARIVFRQVLFCSIELPGGNSAFRAAGSVCFSWERTLPGVLPESLTRALPGGALCYSFFIQDWHSHIHIAATDLDFSWSKSSSSA
jgi:hypothetical protein